MDSRRRNFTATAERVKEEPGSKNIAGNGEDAQATAAQNAAKKESKGKDEAAFQDGLVNLVYQIEEGPQTRVRKILLTGYNHTRPGVIRREILVQEQAPLREGEVVDYRSDDCTTWACSIE